MLKVTYFLIKNTGAFSFEILHSSVASRGVPRDVIGTCDKILNSNFLWFLTKRKYTTIHIFRSLDWLSCVICRRVVTEHQLISHYNGFRGPCGDPCVAASPPLISILERWLLPRQRWAAGACISQWGLSAPFCCWHCSLFLQMAPAILCWLKPNLREHTRLFICVTVVQGCCSSFTRQKFGWL